MNNAPSGDLDIGADECLRMYFGAGGDAGGGADVGRGTDTAEMRLSRRVKVGDDLGERPVYVANGDEGPIRRLKHCGDDDRRGFRAGELGGELGMIGERDLAGPRGR